MAVSGGIGESVVAIELSQIAAQYPQLDIGSYPWFRQGRYGTSLVVRGTDDAAVKAAADMIFALVARHGGEPELEKQPLSE
jgi:hypothetical protein